MDNMNKSIKKFAKSRVMEALRIYGVSQQEEAVAVYVIAQLSRYNPDLLYTDGYGNVHAMFKKGKNKTVLHLNAHLDTVKATIENKTVVQSNDVVKAYDYNGKQTILGADDRAGIASIITVLEMFKRGLCKFDGVLKVSFYKEEEIGCIGSSKSDLSFIEDVDLSITFDRQGSSDVVVGTWGKPFCSNEVGLWVEKVARDNKMKYFAVSGGLSDAFTLAENYINAINLSVGYYNQHTDKEYLVLSEMYQTIDYAIHLMNDLTRVAHTFTGVPRSNHWVDGMYNTTYSKYTTSYSNDKGWYEVAPVAFFDKQSNVTVIDNGVAEIEIYDEYELLDLIDDLNAIYKQVYLNKNNNKKRNKTWLTNNKDYDIM